MTGNLPRRIGAGKERANRHANLMAAIASVVVYNQVMTALLDLGVYALGNAYRTGALDVRQMIEEVLKRIAAAGDDKVWITRVPDDVLRTQADALRLRRGELLPLLGIPFAVKDNIDVAGMPTTAGCPAYACGPAAVRQIVDG